VFIALQVLGHALFKLLPLAVDCQLVVAETWPLRLQGRPCAAASLVLYVICHQLVATETSAWPPEVLTTRLDCCSAHAFGPHLFPVLHRQPFQWLSEKNRFDHTRLGSIHPLLEAVVYYSGVVGVTLMWRKHLLSLHSLLRLSYLQWNKLTVHCCLLLKSQSCLLWKEKEVPGQGNLLQVVFGRQTNFC
jgi:hypothetical protein